MAHDVQREVADDLAVDPAAWMLGSHMECPQVSPQPSLAATGSEAWSEPRLGALTGQPQSRIATVPTGGEGAQSVTMQADAFEVWPDGPDPSVPVVWFSWSAVGKDLRVKIDAKRAESPIPFVLMF